MQRLRVAPVWVADALAVLCRELRQHLLVDRPAPLDLALGSDLVHRRLGELLFEPADDVLGLRERRGESLDGEVLLINHGFDPRESVLGVAHRTALAVEHSAQGLRTSANAGRVGGSKTLNLVGGGTK